jgi:hypothetical protein
MMLEKRGFLPGVVGTLSFWVFGGTDFFSSLPAVCAFAAGARAAPAVTAAAA